MTREDFELWRQMPQTQEKMSDLEARIKELKEHMADGGTISGESAEKTAIATAISVGEIQGLRQLLSVDLDEPKED